MILPCSRQAPEFPIVQPNPSVMTLISNMQDLYVYPFMADYVIVYCFEMALKRRRLFS